VKKTSEDKLENPYENMKIEFDQYDIGPHVQKRPRIISLPPLEALRSKTSIDLWNSSYDDIAYFE
jgi:hypothetical protein